MSKYNERTSRNWGYISEITQKTISEKRVVIAGCGMGSVLADVAARVGFFHFLLIDGDTVERSNLNRQAFLEADIGKNKAIALAERIKAINPEAKVECVSDFLTLENVNALIQQTDIVLDTIDFLDLTAVTALHDACFEKKIPIVTAMNAGFGALAIFIPPVEAEITPFRKIFGLSKDTDISKASYRNHYVDVFTRLAPALDPKVVEIMNHVFKEFANGKPCPAPQLAPGSYTTASLVVTMLVRYLAGDKVLSAPSMIGVDLNRNCQTEILRIVD